MTGYDKGFYDTIRDGTRASADVVAPLVMDLIGPAVSNVIDVGCGEGWWAETFAGLGCEVIGVDGEYVTTSPLGDRFIPHDLTLPLPEHLGGRFDLAVCLEVAEHLDASRAPGLVQDLVDLAPYVLFSAAIPGQGGTHHVNEQWPDYWADLFTGDGRFRLSVTGGLRMIIWEDDRVENWYRQNLMLVYDDAYDRQWRAEEDAAGREVPGSLEQAIEMKTSIHTMRRLVHPVLYDARRR